MPDDVAERAKGEQWNKGQEHLISNAKSRAYSIRLRREIYYPATE